MVDAASVGEPGEAGHEGEEEVRTLYLHLPFRARLSPFSEPNVTLLSSGEEGGAAQAAEQWLAAVGAEWRAVQEEGLFRVAPLRTLYIGGGTPSLLGGRAIEGVRDLLGSRLLGEPGLEWTAEAEPEDLTGELVAAWRDAGVNRISLAVESFQEGAVDWLQGRDPGRDAVAVIEEARRRGIPNLNIDLVFGLPDRVKRDWSLDLERTLALRLPHVTLHEIGAEPGTPFANLVERGEEALASERRVEEEYLLAAKMLTAAGYVHYEVSTFALPGFESRHAWAYWSGKPYLGLGNSASSYLHPLRRWNLVEWEGYLTTARGASMSEKHVGGGKEQLGREEARLEAVWLGLRTRRGLPLEALPPEASPIIECWNEQGWAVTGEGSVRLTAGGWLRLDRLVVELEGEMGRRALGRDED